MNVQDVHMQYITEDFDENGVVNKFDLRLPENFSFAYDIIDKIAEIEPDRRAMIWCDDEGRERIFTYGELSLLSNRAANMLLDKGVKKGDKVGELRLYIGKRLLKTCDICAAEDICKKDFKNVLSEMLKNLFYF